MNKMTKETLVSKNGCASAKYEKELSLCIRLARSLTYCYNSRGL